MKFGKTIVAIFKSQKQFPMIKFQNGGQLKLLMPNPWKRHSKTIQK